VDFPCPGGFAARICSTLASTTLLCPPRPGARRLPQLLRRARQGPFFFPARPGNAEMASAIPPLLPSSPWTPTPCFSDAPGPSLSFPLLARSNNDDARWGRCGGIAHTGKALYLATAGSERAWHGMDFGVCRCSRKNAKRHTPVTTVHCV
jgi:hypothetical protein